MRVIDHESTEFKRWNAERKDKSVNVKNSERETNY
jgi:hypothetical protein